jgi:hypothetical protein
MRASVHGANPIKFAAITLASVGILLSCESLPFITKQPGTPGEVKDMRGGYRFWHDKAEVTVSAFNAGNDKHKEHPLGDTIGSRGWDG